MSSVRQNTLVVDFSVLPVRPDAAKVQNFLEHQIGLDLSDVKSIQLHNTRNCVYIEMQSNDIALRYEKAHNLQREFICKDKPFKIPVYVDSEAVIVRVHDLPPSMPHLVVGNYMKRFGDVISIQHERWKNYFPGVFNGVRVLHMRLKQSIPSFVTINSEVAMILHPNQTKTCRYCTRPVHPNKKCLEVTASEIINSATALATEPPPSNQIFRPADFPPINIDNQSTSSTSDESNKTQAQDNSASDKHEKSRLVPTPLDQGKQNSANNDNEGDDDDDGNASSSSASPYETDNSTNKRRLSTKRGAEKKKMCAIQRTTE